MFLDGNNINIFISFLAGTITFFASCLLPLVPIYLAYLSGVSLTTTKKSEKNKILRTSIAFVVGFISVFILLGATFSTLNRALSSYKFWIEKAGGTLFILLGLYLTGIFQLNFLSKDFHFKLNKWFKKKTTLHAFLTGITFGFGWTPCVGPVLGVILYWSSQQATFLQGFVMLLFYGLGLGLPFVLTGLLFEKASPFLKKTQKLGNTLQKIAGVIIILAGILLLTGKLQDFTLYLIDLFGLRTLSF